MELESEGRKGRSNVPRAWIRSIHEKRNADMANLSCVPHSGSVMSIVELSPPSLFGK